MTTFSPKPSPAAKQTAESLPQPKSLDESAVLLQQILRAVEKDERSRWFEITCAIVLSLATTASAWSAYEATLWSGVQTFRLAAAN